MFEPKPVGSAVASRSKPIKILSKSNLILAWNASRDSTSDAGSAGIDKESAKQFAANLDSKIEEIKKRLHEGTYGFSGLRPVFIRKQNSDKERVICVPTVRDRIVQRAIVNYLASTKKLPIYNASSFGFLKGQGTANAISKAVELRSVYDWCVKADIESFFDQVPRHILKERVSNVLQSHSLVPLIWKAIDCEVRGTTTDIKRAAAQGIKSGLGIRQGMPLSPLLANLTLSKFDRAVEAHRIPMVRYADDLLLFFSSEEEAKLGQAFVDEHLGRVGLKLSHKKTFVYGPEQNVTFLGLEIAFLKSLEKYVARVSRPQIQKIKDRLESDYSYEEIRKSSNTLNEATARLTRSIAAYLGVYRSASDYVVLRDELERTMRIILSNLYSDIFGVDVCEKLDDRAKRFLGIHMLTMPTPSRDLEW
jgi:RNA-directed DNA polymerase